MIAKDMKEMVKKVHELKPNHILLTENLTLFSTVGKKTRGSGIY